MLNTLNALINAYKNYDLRHGCIDPDEATDFVNSYRLEQYDPCDDEE